MRRFLTVALTVVVLLSAAISASANEWSGVVYNGEAKDFIYGADEENPTNLFSALNDVMPGDSLTQRISVVGHVEEEQKARIYLRAVGTNEEDKAFLSKLALKISKASDDGKAYVFDGAASQVEGLEDWVYLGTVYSGGRTDLELQLDVPRDLGDEFQGASGRIGWEFRVEEMPVGELDPAVNQKNEKANMALFITAPALTVAVCVLPWLVKLLKKKA